MMEPDPTPFESTVWYPIPLPVCDGYELGDAMEVRALGRVGGDLPAKVRITRDTKDRLRFSTTWDTVSLAEAVAAIIHGPRPKGEVVRHLDDDCRNNYGSNIAYGTQADNIADSLRNGTFPIGTRNGRAKLTESDVREIRQSSDSIGSLVRRFRVDRKTIIAVLECKTWKHVV